MNIVIYGEPDELAMQSVGSEGIFGTDLAEKPRARWGICVFLTVVYGTE